MSFTSNFLTKLDTYNAAHGAFNPKSAPIQEFLNRQFPNSNSQPYPGLNDKLAAFDAINTGTFYPELAKIKYLLLDSNRANTFIYTYRSADAGYFASILSNLQKLFPDMFIYYNKSSYQTLIYNSIRYISTNDTDLDAINSINTVFISQSELTTHLTALKTLLTGQLIFTYTGSSAPTDKNQLPFIEASDITISSFNASIVSNIVTVTVNITYEPAIINESSNFGLSFANVIGFYQNNATNINILTLTNIPLSKAGSQFSGLTTLSITTGQNPIIRSGTSLLSCFNECSNFNSDISDWDTTNVTTMASMFNSATNFNNGDIGNNGLNPLNWVTTNVTTMASMFSGAVKFNQYIGNWITTSLTSTYRTFSNASVFNNGDNGNNCSKPLNWNTSIVTNMSSMFFGAVKFNQYIGDWNTSKVVTMVYVFANASAFNNGDNGNNCSKPLNWDTSIVTNMPYMFANAVKFNQYIGNWNTCKVTNINYIFNNTQLFNNGDIPSGTTKKMGSNPSSQCSDGWYFNGTLSSSNWRTGSGLTDNNAPSSLVF